LGRDEVQLFFIRTIIDNIIVKNGQNFQIDGTEGEIHLVIAANRGAAEG
jgi:hypothetical protein